MLSGHSFGYLSILILYFIILNNINTIAAKAEEDLTLGSPLQAAVGITWLKMNLQVIVMACLAAQLHREEQTHNL